MVFAVGVDRRFFVYRTHGVIIDFVANFVCFKRTKGQWRDQAREDCKCPKCFFFLIQISCFSKIKHYRTTDDFQIHRRLLLKYRLLFRDPTLTGGTLLYDNMYNPSPENKVLAALLQRSVQHTQYLLRSTDRENPWFWRRVEIVSFPCFPYRCGVLLDFRRKMVCSSSGFHRRAKKIKTVV